MVLPLFDDNSDRRNFPFVNYTIIALNFFVFVFLQQMGAERNWFTEAFATVPEEILTGKDVEGRVLIENPLTGEVVGDIELARTPIPVYFTLLTSMFMHGGWLHLLGNMLFLWIFGDNVEDFVGSVAYGFFYVGCGILAGLAHVAFTYATGGNLLIPCLGASGAISGILGAYLFLFPHRQVTVLLFRFLTVVPAWVAIGIWFLLQLVQSLGKIERDIGGGVAYGAHIGGFLAGMALIQMFRNHPFSRGRP